MNILESHAARLSLEQQLAAIEARKREEELANRAAAELSRLAEEHKQVSFLLLFL